MRKQPFSYLYNSKELFVQNIIFHLTTSIRENPLLNKGCYSCYLSKKAIKTYFSIEISQSSLNFFKTTEKLTMLVIKTNIMSFSHFDDWIIR